MQRYRDSTVKNCWHGQFWFEMQRAGDEEIGFGRILFLAKVFSEIISRRNYEKQKFSGKVLFFLGVFRRHHVANDPINWVDPSGLLFGDAIANHYSPGEQVAIGTALGVFGARAFAGAVQIARLPGGAIPATVAAGLGAALALEGGMNAK